MHRQLPCDPEHMSTGQGVKERLWELVRPLHMGRRPARTLPRQEPACLLEGEVAAQGSQLLKGTHSGCDLAHEGAEIQAQDSKAPVRAHTAGTQAASCWALRVLWGECGWS